MKTSREVKNEFSEQKPLPVQVTYSGKKGKVFYIAFDPNSSFIVTGHDKTICIYNNQGVFCKKINMRNWDKHEIRGIAVNSVSSEKYIIVANTANCLQKLSVDTYEPTEKYNFDEPSINLPKLLDFVGNGTLKIERANPFDFFSIFITSSSSFLIPKPTGSSVDVIHLKDSKKITLGIFDDDDCVKWNAHDISSNNLLAIAIAKTISIFDINTGKKLKKLGEHTGRITCVTFTPDNRYIISGSDDKTIRIWDVETGFHLKELNIHSEMVLSVAISPNGKHLASGDASGNILIWDFPKLIQSAIPSSDSKEKAPETRLLKNFYDVLEDPGRFSIQLLSKMFADVQSLEEYKLPYTLANIELHHGTQHIKIIKKNIYQCLEKLANTCPSGDHKDSSKQASLYIARYKLALNLACEKGFISEGEQYFLQNQAEDNKTFSDERFTALQHEIHVLKERIKVTEHNIDTIAININELKKALKTKARRDCISSIAKIAIGFMVGPLVDLFANVFDLSDAAALGAAALKIDTKQWHELVHKGAAGVKEIVNSAVGEAIKASGYDPEALIYAWVEATVNLEVASSAALSISPSHTPNAAAPLSALANPEVATDSETINTVLRTVKKNTLSLEDQHGTDEVKNINTLWTDSLSKALKEHKEQKGSRANVFTILSKAQSELISQDSKLYKEQHFKENINKEYQKRNAEDDHLTKIYQERAKLAQMRLGLFSLVIESPGFSVTDIKGQVKDFSNRLDKSLKKFRKSGLRVYADTPQKQIYKETINHVSAAVKRFK